MPSDAIEKDRPGKVFVGGLPTDVDEKALEEKFSKFGRLTETILIRDKGNNKSRGFGFVTFENPLDGEDAVKTLNGQELKGKTIHVEQATKPHRARVSRNSSDRNKARSRSPVRRRSLSDRDRRMRAPRPGGPTRGGSSMGPRRGSGVDRRGGGGSYRGSRGAPRGRGGYSGGSSYSSYGRDSFEDRKPMPMKSGLDRSERPMFGSGPRRGPPPSHDSPPRRGEGDRYAGNNFDRMDRMDRMDRPERMDRGAPPRRDSYPSPTRDYGRGPPVDSRMPPSRGSARDYPQTSRDYPPPAREYSPPAPSRDYPSRDSYSSYDRAPGPRERAPPPARDRAPASTSYEYTRDYGMTSRDSYNSAAPSRSNFGAPSRDTLLTPRDEYNSGRESFRSEPASRDYGLSSSSYSREFSSSRAVSSRSEYDRGPPPSREYDSYRENGRQSGPPSRPSGPPSRAFSSASGSGRDNGMSGRQTSSRGGPYNSPTSHGLPQSRGPPQRGPPSGSRGAPPREDRGRDGFGAGSRRPPPSDSRGPPMKRPRPGVPSRGGGPPFRR
ncbi:RNA binding motif protein, X-linked-like-1 isoform X1 [Pecten maximus]|uniref:RNA binding motif protein, X-linked-like-1 isoform X1 n=1 Tax=Pecten maximus TaxID=6579 RepID=UPI001458CA12|nr:RNA binding motif protein, X-linked-like-1 isoform X1 [Pecten maximus]XP_033761134.1 RNA binding motif protein, X-linked-like-1 isoform X1 [Pecten maximus]XP_033761135.1 RNA binding motif protein, X-linked-like-1 isoform X1 [Pecten maximus]